MRASGLMWASGLTCESFGKFRLSFGGLHNFVHAFRLEMTFNAPKLPKIILPA